MTSSTDIKQSTKISRPTMMTVWKDAGVVG